MIRFEGVTKIFVTNGHRKVVLDNTSVNIDTRYAYGIFGPNGAGKSTTLRLIAGSDIPNKGKITKDLRVSWPLGFAGGFHPDMTGKPVIVRIGQASIKDDIHRWMDEWLDPAYPVEIVERGDLPETIHSCWIYGNCRL